jgi:AcrR family transcriptional regulator
MEAEELKIFVDNHVFDDYTAKQVRIISAAIDVFARKGYANSSTHEIAVEAGVAEGNIFSKFGSKHGLLEAIVQPVVESIFPATINAFISDRFVSDYQTLRDFFGTVLHDRAKFVRANAKVLRILIAELVYNQSVRDQVIKNVPAGYLIALNTKLNQLKATGELVNWDNRDILRMILSVAGGFLASTLFFDFQATPTMEEHLITALTKALTPDNH